jgi:hypothetical protein
VSIDPVQGNAACGDEPRNFHILLPICSNVTTLFPYPIDYMSLCCQIPLTEGEDAFQLVGKEFPAYINPVHPPIHRYESARTETAI